MEFPIENYEESLDRRIDIRRSVMEGKISQAIEMINDLHPELLDDNSYLHFHLLV